MWDLEKRQQCARLSRRSYDTLSERCGQIHDSKLTSMKHVKNATGSMMKKVDDRFSVGVSMSAGRSTSRARNAKCSTFSTCLSSVRCKQFKHFQPQYNIP